MAEGGEMTFLGRSDRGVVCRSIAVIINIKYECLRICANATFLLFAGLLKTLSPLAGMENVPGDSLGLLGKVCVVTVYFG